MSTCATTSKRTFATISLLPSMKHYSLCPLLALCILNLHITGPVICCHGRAQQPAPMNYAHFIENSQLCSFSALTAQRPWSVWLYVIVWPYKIYPLLSRKQNSANKYNARCVRIFWLRNIFWMLFVLFDERKLMAVHDNVLIFTCELISITNTPQ